MTAKGVARRTVLATGLSFGLVGTALAQMPLQVKQSFKNTVSYLVNHNSQFFSPPESYFSGTRQFVTDNAQSFFVPYGQVDYVYPNRISVTATGEWTGECVAFVKGVTTQWFQASELKGIGGYIHSGIPKYSVIGVFGTSDSDDNGNALYSYDYGHVAIYLGTMPDNSGIVVMDQNHDHGGTLAIHTIPWYSSSSDRVLSASKYRIVVK